MTNLSSETDPTGVLKSFLGFKNKRNLLEDEINSILAIQKRQSKSNDIYSVVSFDTITTVLEEGLSVSRPFIFFIENKRGEKDVL